MSQAQPAPDPAVITSGDPLDDFAALYARLEMGIDHTLDALAGMAELAAGQPQGEQLAVYLGIGRELAALMAEAGYLPTGYRLPPTDDTTAPSANDNTDPEPTENA